MELKIDKIILTEKDQNLIDAFKTDIKLNKNSNINQEWIIYKQCKFRNHKLGKAGNHIWINRNCDDKRIAIITD